MAEKDQKQENLTAEDKLLGNQQNCLHKIYVAAIPT